jgi:hypothetical protein
MSKGDVKRHGIYGMILNMIEPAQQRDNRAKSAAAYFRTKKLSFCTKEYPQIGQFPVPVQKLIYKQLERVEDQVQKAKPLPHYEDETLFCHCRFAREYLLPSNRIFYLDIYGPDKVLTPE